MIRIAIVVASTRPGRRGDQVARWVYEQATARTPAEAGVEYAVVDLAEVDLPMLDEPVPAAIGDYRHDHTRQWADLVASFDGFVFVTPEYNRGVPAPLKNAIDYLFAEWQDKAAGIVGYGVVGGVRASEHLRQVLAELRVADVRTAVTLSLTDDLADGTVAARPHRCDQAKRMLDELAAWTNALRALRTE